VCTDQWVGGGPCGGRAWIVSNCPRSKTVRPKPHGNAFDLPTLRDVGGVATSLRKARRTPCPPGSVCGGLSPFHSADTKKTVRVRRPFECGRPVHNPRKRLDAILLAREWGSRRSSGLSVNQQRGSGVAVSRQAVTAPPWKAHAGPPQHGNHLDPPACGCRGALGPQDSGR
jgi:hypothetical protein